MVLNKRLKRGVISIFVCVIIIIIIGFLMGIKTILGIFQFCVLFFLILSISIIVIDCILKWCERHISIKKADEDELEREDDILLQATGFSQSILFIYLTLLPRNEIIEFLKVLVASTAFVFYIIRASAKLKKNNTLRYYSLYSLVLIISISFTSLIMTIIEYDMPNIISIDNISVTRPILGPFFMLSSFLGPMNFIEDVLKRRYFTKESREKNEIRMYVTKTVTSQV